MNGGKNDLNNNDLCISALNHFTVASMASLSFKSLKNSKKLNDYDLCISALHFSVGSLSFKSLKYPLNKKPTVAGARACVSAFCINLLTDRSRQGGEKKYYKKYHTKFYTGRPLYNTYYFLST